MQDDFRRVHGCRRASGVFSSLVLVACALEPFEAAQGSDAGGSASSDIMVPSTSPSVLDDDPVSTPAPSDSVQQPTEPGRASPAEGSTDEDLACTDCDAGTQVGSDVPVGSGESLGSDEVVVSDEHDPDTSEVADTDGNLDSGLGPSATRADAATVPSPTQDGSDQAEPVEPGLRCGDDELLGPHGHCYFLSEQVTTWPEAREACLLRGDDWDMVAVEDATEHEWISLVLAQDTWMGASDAEQSDTWKWVATDQVFWLGAADGEAVDGAFTRWWEDAPSDTGDREQCGRFRERDDDYYWADMQCDSEFPYLCETLGPAQ